MLFPNTPCYVLQFQYACALSRQGNRKNTSIMHHARGHIYTQISQGCMFGAVFSYISTGAEVDLHAHLLV